MQVNISGRHLEVTAPLREHVNEKLHKLETHFPKMSEKISNVEVSLSVINKHEQCAKASANVLGGKNICASSTKTDLYGAINEMVQELMRQMSDYKGKITKH